VSLSYRETAIAEILAREFFAAIDARDPKRLLATLADHATFRALPHSAPIRPAEEIVSYFGTVVSSYPEAHGEVSDIIATTDRAAVQFVFREFSDRLGREMLSEQVAIFRVVNGKIISIVGYYDTTEFRRLFWDEAV
jgi:ketosteroid isomerase-like protein